MKPYPQIITVPALLLATMLLCSCAVDSVHGNNNIPAIAGPLAASDHTVVFASFPPPPTTSKKKIKIALLLDTSNSMDGLIDQARAQLWKLVNELGQAKAGDEKPELQLALYEYGNDGLNMETGFVRQVSQFTDDLDLISEKLFSLRTNGGSEYCGQVISSASQQLDWKENSQDLQLIFIAGNESFFQGAINSSESCSHAKEKDIIVNTIFCGEYGEGISLGWKNGAQMAHGSYMCIEKDEKMAYIETPFDNEIAVLNGKLNHTYLTYGSQGDEKKANQLKQDENSESYGRGACTNRFISKAGSFYCNSSWDLVDASKDKGFDLAKVKETDLPAELRGKPLAEKQQYLDVKIKERAAVVKEIEQLNVKRNAYIAQISRNTPASKSLDAAMIKAIREQAAKKNFVFGGC